MSKPNREAYRASQITIDLDNPTGLRILSTWHNMQSIGTMEGRISASGKGVHIRCKPDIPVSYADMLLIRQQHADDTQRVYFDLTAPESKPIMILFCEKRGKVVDDWLSDPIRLIDRYGAKI